MSLGWYGGLVCCCIAVQGAVVPGGGPVIEPLGLPSVIEVLLVDFRNLSQISALRAHNTGIPIPTPTPRAILLVVVNPAEGEGVGVSEEEEVAEDESEAEVEDEDTGEARLRVFIAVAVAAVAVVVVVVLGSVMLKYVETKPSGPSGFTQRKNSLE
jgi:hypothetical protein